MKNLFYSCFIFVYTLSFGQAGKDSIPVLRGANEKFDKLIAENFRKEINAEYASKDKSPLTDEDKAHFKGLPFFPIDEKYFVIAEFVRTENEKPFGMKTSTSRLPMYEKYGELHFTIEGKLLKLNVYRSLDLAKQEQYKDYLFLPFSDLTNGKETYLGGRYIDLKIPQGNTMAIDFNQAYNPYCAYNHKYSCPAVPQENVLDVEIRAGVLKPHE
jgi:uncharacterized protein (DUF1684 family)